MENQRQQQQDNGENGNETSTSPPRIKISMPENDRGQQNNTINHTGNNTSNKQQSVTTTTTKTTNNNNRRNKNQRNNNKKHSTGSNLKDVSEDKLLNELAKYSKLQTIIQAQNKKSDDFRLKWLKRFLWFMGVLGSWIIIRVFISYSFLKRKYAYMISIVDETYPKLNPFVQSSIGKGIKIAAAIEYPLLSFFLYQSYARNFPQAVMYATYSKSLNSILTKQPVDMLQSMYSVASGNVPTSSLCSYEESVNLSSKCIACTAAGFYSEDVPKNCQIGYCEGIEKRDWVGITSDALLDGADYGIMAPFFEKTGGAVAIAVGVVSGGFSLYESISENNKISKQCEGMQDICVQVSGC